jgi:hypothetical protein
MIKIAGDKSKSQTAEKQEQDIFSGIQEMTVVLISTPLMVISISNSPMEAMR